MGKVLYRVDRVNRERRVGGGWLGIVVEEIEGI